MEKAVILVIDDEAPVRRLISKVLMKEGYDVLTAAGGEEAISIAKEKKIDLAMVDMKMPGIDGIETIRRIKEINMGVAFVIITAFAEMSTLKDAAALGVFDYITKPFDLDYLKHLTKHILIGVKPKVMPYLEDTTQVFTGKLQLEELKRRKITALKADVKERYSALKETDKYTDRAIAMSYKTSFGLMKYRVKKLITNMYFIVTVLGIAVGSLYGYVYGAMSARPHQQESISLEGERPVGIADFYGVLKDLAKWLRIHTIQDKGVYQHNLESEPQ
ncbi:MAG: response regulator [Candidatus Omnitrophica bacterium]|nr:response regulator [Candidatus Omnitrophota bacterium]